MVEMPVVNEKSVLETKPVVVRSDGRVEDTWVPLNVNREEGKPTRLFLRNKENYKQKKEPTLRDYYDWQLKYGDKVKCVVMRSNGNEESDWVWGGLVGLGSEQKALVMKKKEDGRFVYKLEEIETFKSWQ